MNKNTQALHEVLVFALEIIWRKDIKLKEQQYEAVTIYNYELYKMLF
jgi:hypothetical protein